MDALIDAAMQHARVHGDLRPRRARHSWRRSQCRAHQLRLTKDSDVDMAVDKENKGAQRAASNYRSCTLWAILFDMQPLNKPSEADTRSLSGNTRSPAAAAVSTASPLTATSVGTRAAEMFSGGTSMPAVKPRQPPVVEAPTFGLASLAFAAAADVHMCQHTLAYHSHGRCRASSDVRGC